MNENDKNKTTLSQEERQTQGEGELRNTMPEQETPLPETNDGDKLLSANTETESRNFWQRVKDWWKNTFRNEHYMSAKEVKRIGKENMRTMRAFEKRKKRRADESEFVTQMRDDKNIVEFENLHTYFYSDVGVVKAVNGVSFDIPQGSIVGVVGESGCGKSVTSLSLMQLVQAPQGQITDGSIRFKSRDYKRDKAGQLIPVYEYQTDEQGNQSVVTEPQRDKKGNPVLGADGQEIRVPKQATDSAGVPQYEMEEKVYDIAKMPIREMTRVRGRQIAMIFQEPMTSLNPIFTIGNQLDEVTLLHVPGATKQTAKNKSLEMLNLVGIAMPERVYKSYPHELSGGMRQRVMIAMALACNPRLIIADEPTTALDVTIQAQILDLLRDIKHRIEGSIMLITHDLGIIAEMAEYVVVMYAGRIIEMGTAEEIFDDPRHPYTIGLQKSKPSMDKASDKLFTIPGNVPNPINMPDHCYFKERCSRCTAACGGAYPQMVSVSPTHRVACYLYGDGETNNGGEVKAE